MPAATRSKKKKKENARRHSISATGLLAGAKGKGALRAGEEEGQSPDHISDLPDAVLGDIVSRLPTKDGARTQALSTWRSAPLNLDLRSHPIPLGEVPRILSSHRGPGRCFSTPARYYEDLRDPSAVTLDGWLNNLQELDFDYDLPYPDRGNPPPLPASALRFSCTLRIARFRCCRFPDGINVRLPVLQQLALSGVIISESSLHALLAGCPVLQNLWLTSSDGYSRARIVSPTLRSIHVSRGSGDLSLQQLIIEDAPCLERLYHFSHRKVMHILVISAPKLGILGHLSDEATKLEIGTTVFQGLRLVNMTTVVCCVKILALTNGNLSLDVAMNFLRCFPCWRS